MKITADYREKSSGIINLMERAGIDVKIGKITYGDYIINDRVTIERKTSTDFLVSIIDGRLFRQAARLKSNVIYPFFLIEGNPFRTNLKVSRSAIKGALLSIKTIFYLPIVYSRTIEDSVDVMRLMAQQIAKHQNALQLRGGYRPRRLSSRQLFILQGFPGIGPQLAKRLLNRFGSIAEIMTAAPESLREVDGIGTITAKKIREIIETPWPSLNDRGSAVLSRVPRTEIDLSLFK